MNDIARFLAEKMGWPKRPEHMKDLQPGIIANVMLWTDKVPDFFDPRNNIAHAFLVVDAMIERPEIREFDLSWDTDWEGNERWGADFITHENNLFSEWGTIPAEAISQAAFKALGGEL